jgi:hypothetical protein
MSYGNELTAADVAAVTHNGSCGGFGGFGGDGGWLAILFILALFGGFGGNRGGYGAGGACATPLDVHTAVDQQTLLSKLDAQTYGIADATFALNNSIKDGFYNAELSRSKCCCETQRLIERGICDITHQMSDNTRDIIDNNNCNTRAILDFLVNDKISNLRDENAALKLAASQAAQNNYIIGQLRPAPVPAYNVPNPYSGCGCGCGCGGSGYGYGYNG